MNKNPSSREAPTCANCTVFGKLWQTADRWVIYSHWPGKNLYDFPSLWHAMSSFCRKPNLASHELQQNGDAQHCLQDIDKVARSWPATWSFLQAYTQYSIVSFERIPAYCREKPFPNFAHKHPPGKTFSPEHSSTEQETMSHSNDGGVITISLSGSSLLSVFIYSEHYGWSYFKNSDCIKFCLFVLTKALKSPSFCEDNRAEDRDKASTAH